MTALEEILEHKREEVERVKRLRPLDRLKGMKNYGRATLSLSAALRSGSPAVIAEFKRASPSRGVIREDLDPVTVARSYSAGGAAALSVLTDERFFKGCLEDIAAIRPHVGIPILRKDFILDPYQVHEARAFGADAILLIAAALDGGALAALHREARKIGMEALVEVHNEAEIRALEGGGYEIIGVNNRDLHTFVTDLQVTFRLLRLLPRGVIAVSESGIGGAADVARLRMAGAQAVLIGESLMRAPEPGAALRELLAAAKEPPA